MLRQALPLCIKLGIERALVSCDTDNVASRKVIEKNGGVFDSITDLPDLKKQKRLYWIYPNR
jgi:predicted acetyltransferase